MGGVWGKGRIFITFDVRNVLNLTSKPLALTRRGNLTRPISNVKGPSHAGLGYVRYSFRAWHCRKSYVGIRETSDTEVSPTQPRVIQTATDIIDATEAGRGAD